MISKDKGPVPASPGSLRWVATVHAAVMIVACVVLLPAISPAQAVGGDGLIKLLFLSRMLILVVLATGLLRLRGLTWSDTGLRRPNWRTFSAAVPLGLIASFLAVGISRWASTQLGFEAADYSTFSALKGNLLEYLFWLIPVSLVSAAVGEELLFRGFFLNTLCVGLGGSRVTGSVLAIIANAVIFGALHIYQGPAGALSAGVIGLVLGFVWLLSGRNLWAGIVIHALLDGASMTAIYFGVMAR